MHIPVKGRAILFIARQAAMEYGICMMEYVKSFQIS